LSYKCKLVQIGDADSCRANFEELASTSNALGKYFIAQPWHSQNKKPVRICWNFGDNHDTCIQYLTTYTGTYGAFHLYDHPGTYNVCVNILYDGGCESHYCRSVPVDSPHPDSCRADFEKLLTTTNNPLHVYYRALPWHNNNKKPEQVCWSFGDNHDTCINYDPAIASNYIVSHNYANTGIYNVCVRIKYQGGCIAYKCKPVQVGLIIVLDSCRADFERLPLTSVNDTLLAHFRALPWNNHNKKPARICWSFGDGRDTCIQYPENYTGAYVVGHHYNHPGTYEVCVKINYYGGCEARKCKLIQIGEPDSCRADFEAGLISSTPLGRHFTAIPWSNHNKKPVYICWNFGDNHDTCIHYSNIFSGPYGVNHTYANAGQYEVCVKIIYDGGCEARKCKLVQVGEPDSCRADFERLPPDAVNDLLFAHFRALPWNNHNKKPALICWTFGDGRDTCIQYSENYTGTYIVGHHYNHPGNYEVCVKINYYGGCEARKCRIVNILTYNDSCRVHIFEIAPSVTSLTRGFYFVASAGSGQPKRICWYFGDGADTCIMVDSNATQIPYSIRHTYLAPGVYRACVKVLFRNGCIAEDCKEVVIRSLTDICGGYYTDSLINPHTYLFKGFSIHNPNDAVVSYRWTFGDGTTGTGQQITHTYNAPGIYRVCLLINTEHGCETRICNDVRIAGATQSILQLSPNPVVNILHVLFYSAYTETVTIRIINSNGVVVRTYTRNAVVGPNSWDLDESGLLAGVYSLVVQSPGQFASGVFLKQ